LSFVQRNSLFALAALSALAGCPKASQPPSQSTARRASQPPLEDHQRSDSLDAAATHASDAQTPRPTTQNNAGASPSRGPYNVLYLTIDSLRSDVLHPRGALPAAFGEDPARFAPTLTALARRGVTYTRAYALSSYTSMSVGGMYGGRMPGELPRDGYFFGEYRPSALMLAERLSAAGVHTMAAHAHFYFRRGGSGLEQGFARWEVVPGLVRVQTTDVEVTSDRLEALIERLLSEPRCATNDGFSTRTSWTRTTSTVITAARQSPRSRAVHEPIT